jgi:isocitrate dehydrogenase
MMKVSDPIIFGHAVRAYFADVFATHAATFDELGVDPNLGLADLLGRVATLPDDRRTAIEADIATALANGPALAMVDSDRGITNLHVPNDVIVDASMPVVVRDSGSMWGPDGKLAPTKAMIPDRCYATYRAILEDCQANAFDQRGSAASERRAHGRRPGRPKQDLHRAPGGARSVWVDAAGKRLETVAEAGDIFPPARLRTRPRDGLAVAHANHRPQRLLLD